MSDIRGEHLEEVVLRMPDEPSFEGRGPRRIAVMSHSYPDETNAALLQLIEVATSSDVEVLVSPDETRKHNLKERSFEDATAARLMLDAGSDEEPDLCLVLGGDGSILEALRTYAGHSVPVFGVNFGRIGFLATTEHGELGSVLKSAIGAEFEVLSLPALTIKQNRQKLVAFNDVGFHRKSHGQVAELAVSLGGREVSNVRCDGLVAATPVGSTGYNLANGGPVLAWGVQGYVVSFIAPHTLTARPLVVAPPDVLHVKNLSTRESVDVTVDGGKVVELSCEQELEIGFHDDMGCLAQMPGTNFYQRFRTKFGLLSA